MPPHVFILWPFDSKALFRPVYELSTALFFSSPRLYQPAVRAKHSDGLWLSCFVDFKELTKRQTLLHIGIDFKFRNSLAVSDRIQMLQMHPVRKIKSIVINQKAVEMLKSLHGNGFFYSCQPIAGRPSSDYVWTHWALINKLCHPASGDLKSGGPRGDI